MVVVEFRRDWPADQPRQSVYVYPGPVRRSYWAAPVHRGLSRLRRDLTLRVDTTVCGAGWRADGNESARNPPILALPALVVAQKIVRDGVEYVYAVSLKDCKLYPKAKMQTFIRRRLRDRRP
jgi:hypothetical protein